MFSVGLHVSCRTGSSLAMPDFAPRNCGHCSSADATPRASRTRPTMRIGRRVIVCSRARRVGNNTTLMARRRTVGTERRIAIAGLALILGTALVAATLAAPDPRAERFWPQWRGPYATGVSKYADPPLEWGESKIIRWKVEIPGRGSASPVIWGDRIFVLS